MSATMILHKRKAGAFVSGDLAAGEIGIDIENAELYFSSNGFDVVRLEGIGGGGEPSGTVTTPTTAVKRKSMTSSGKARRGIRAYGSKEL